VRQKGTLTGQNSLSGLPSEASSRWAIVQSPIKDLVGYFDWTLNEECFQYHECDLLQPFSAAGKAVFQVEYKGSTTSFCPTANANNWNSMLMPLKLDGGRTPCR